MGIIPMRQQGKSFLAHKLFSGLLKNLSGAGL